jgi:phosphatidylglycerophosphate synthase
MNLPNTLTVARIFLVPLLVSVLLTKFEGRLVMGPSGRAGRRRHLRHRLAHRLA